MLPNPYTPGGTPPRFAGRANEIARLRRPLQTTEALGAFDGPPLVVRGPRGTGKTSLLREVQHEVAEPLGFATAWVSCAKGSAMLPNLADGVRDALARLDSSTTWQNQVSKWSVEVGLGPVKVGAEFSRPPATEGQTALISTTTQLLDSSAQLIRNRGGAGLAVFIDELHAAPQHDLSVALNAFQQLVGQRGGSPTVVLGAGLSSTPGVLTRAATFAERTHYVTLGPLDEAGSVEAIVDPARELGVRWEPEAVQQIVGDTAGYPYFLQLLASETWNAADPDEGTVLDVDALRAGIAIAHDQIELLYESRWNAATPGEQDFITAMASVTNDDQVASRAAIAGALGVTSRAISDTRDRLLDHDILEPAGHGLLRFTMPGFARYVADTTQDSPEQAVQLGFVPLPQLTSDRSLPGAASPRPTPPTGPTRRRGR